MRRPKPSPPKQPWFSGFMQHTAAHVAAIIIVGLGSAISGAMYVTYTDHVSRVKTCFQTTQPFDARSSH